MLGAEVPKEKLLEMVYELVSISGKGVADGVHLDD